MEIRICRGRLEIYVKSLWMGRDILIFVQGGDAHIGAVSMASKGKIIFSGAMPHHRELELTEDLSIFFSGKLDCTSCVCMGIHYDEITQTEIDEIRHIIHSTLPAFSDILADGLVS